ncbi:Rpn family recombination-promoting nuclease/putative transposase [Acerihabitans sp. TG2]|uniref:Rpn family recombination-promoting nuclease/putative transposase n=1 Tax=Acerihabitans sp. TG2 TaxID=3096008 RepID=UPI002B23EBF5|nr:Rpn family recombination-promoting nuclease/putative transposase [Acerihabitans sp. TG2]MEA9391526.1 Rpn family recombination-promoting nuclease/putative transposase [Acerihabitans sp. TG2]
MQKTLAHHDALFKNYLGDITVARDFLDVHLPPSLRERCDLSSLAMVPGFFVEDDLSTHCSDILYSLKTRDGPGYIYCLIEHQSRPEKMMAFRMMRYSIAAMHQHIKQGGKTLPVVVPLLFYHGETSPYPYSTHWLDCFADPSLAKSMYTQPFRLIDTTAMPDSEILAHKRAAVLELLQKHIRSKDMLEWSHSIGRLLNEWPVSKELVRALLYYIVECGNTSKPDQFLRNIAAEAANNEEDVMTISQELQRVGLQQGIAQGMEKGVEQGEKNAALRFARQLISDGIEYAVVKRYTGLSDKEITALAN